jgi:hypothetical protein
MNRKELIIHVLILLGIVLAFNWGKSLTLQDTISEEILELVIWPSENFIHIVLLFMGMNSFNKGKLGQKDLLIIYGLMSLNVYFQVLLVTSGPIWAKFIYLTFGVGFLWFFYLPQFEKYRSAKELSSAQSDGVN